MLTKTLESCTVQKSQSQQVQGFQPGYWILMLKNMTKIDRTETDGFVSHPRGRFQKWFVGCIGEYTALLTSSFSFIKTCKKNPSVGLDDSLFCSEKLLSFWSTATLRCFTRYLNAKPEDLTLVMIKTWRTLIHFDSRKKSYNNLFVTKNHVITVIAFWSKVWLNRMIDWY